MPRNHGDLPTHFLHLVPIKARRPLYPTTLTYQRMTSYLPTALRSHGVHHPRMPRKPNPEKGPLVDPTDPSVLRNAGYGEKLAGTNANWSQLMNMRPSDPGASPHRYHPCTLPSGLLPPHTCFSPPPSEDHITCSPLPSVNIFWIMTPPPPPPPPPGGFSIPPFAMYDDSSDPYDHMLHFNQAMILNAGDDRLLCKVFPVSLKGPALAWFHKLSRGSINSLGDLWVAFVSQYMCSAR